MKKRIISVVLCLILLMCTFSSCKETKFEPKQKPFDKKIKTSVFDNNTVVADGKNYSLQYDAEKASIKLLEKGGSTEWTATPTPSGEGGNDKWGFNYIHESDFVNSAINVGYMNKKINGGGNGTALSYVNSMQNGRVVCKQLKDKKGNQIGLTIEYYFDDEEFMVPVDFILHDDYLSVSIDTAKIQENEKYQITYVDLLPFMCAVENKKFDLKDEETTEETTESTEETTETEVVEETTKEEVDEESYLFMPSGSGALIQTNEYDVTGLNYEGYIYGEDLTMEDYFDVYSEPQIRMPVYGYKDGNVGGFVIIDEGAETAILKSSSGTTSDSFSTVYPSFQLRSFTEHEARNFNNTYIAKIFPDNMIDGKVSLRFYPLKDDKANYTEMANIYREYLKKQGLKKTGKDKTTNLTIIGGAEVTKSLLGVPYTTVHATTTVDKTSDIVSYFSKDINNMSVKLKGFGNSGVDLGTIGGGFKINGNIGSVKDMKKLSSLCKDEKVDLYMDYDLVKFSSGGSGFSYSKDVVMNCGMIRADQYIFDKAIRTTEKDMKYRLLRPVEFDKAVKKSIKATSKFGVDGISLDTLSSVSYSDYSDYRKTVKYNSKHGFGEAVSNAVSQIKDQKYMASNANAYAAINADIIVDAPTTSADGYAFMETVPFYAMVFKGYVPMASESINLASTPEKILLGAVEGGMALNYTVIGEWDNTLINSVNNYFYASEFNSALKKDILGNYKQLKKYYSSINGATIDKNEVIASGVHCTTFNNGVKVYVNYNVSPVDT